MAGHLHLSGRIAAGLKFHGPGTGTITCRIIDTAANSRTRVAADMGAGVVKGFHERYPDIYEEYRRRCKAKPRDFNPGDSFLWRDNDKPSVFNLGT
ncbi:MAG: hypothetical protein CEE38_14500 [Planctomycetes bacterium B3_Pla]|nr:MAG: hypothetical protein CEE38_14500 [Planctomycetes bacterium B3_Pla]